MRHLANLLDETAELEPPPVSWKAMEVNRCYLTRGSVRRDPRRGCDLVNLHDEGTCLDLQEAR